MQSPPVLAGVGRPDHVQIDQHPAGLLQKREEASSDWEKVQCEPLALAHDSLSPSASNGSAAILPSAFFSRISTRPSASSNCFWHSRDSPTPSSNSFIASSKDSCGLSSRRTTSSSRASERSKSGFFWGSGFFATG